VLARRNDIAHATAFRVRRELLFGLVYTFPIGLCIYYAEKYRPPRRPDIGEIIIITTTDGSNDNNNNYRITKHVFTITRTFSGNGSSHTIRSCVPAAATGMFDRSYNIFIVSKTKIPNKGIPTTVPSSRAAVAAAI